MDGGRAIGDVGGFIFILLVAGVEWKCMFRKLAARLGCFRNMRGGARAYGVVCYWESTLDGGPIDL
jgi:hypothetical protein